MAGGLYAVETGVVTTDPPEASSEAWPAACHPTKRPEKACDDCTPCAMGGMAEGLFTEETLLHAARAAPSTTDDNPTSACSPLGEAELPDARTAAPMQLPSSKGPH